MSRPWLLDLFCGAGGAAMGYHRAGFDVVGVDIRPQPAYPFTFVQADALTYPLVGYDAIHASPPCQGYSSGVSSADSQYVRSRGKLEPRLIADTRQRLIGAGVPFVIENVMGARDELHASLLLCGSMFDLPVTRHRLFESSEYLWSPTFHDCAAVYQARRRYPLPEGMGDDRVRSYGVTGKGRGRGCTAFWRDLMDMPWARTAHELTEAIPPAYTEWIGAQLMAVVRSTHASDVGARDTGPSHRGIGDDDARGRGPGAVDPATARARSNRADRRDRAASDGRARGGGGLHDGVDP